MKKIFFIILCSCITFQMNSYAQENQTNNVVNADQKFDYGLGDVACDAFLFIAGTWLAHQQLPRLAGEQIELNAPRFTKIVASIYFTIGIIGGTIGAYSLAKMLREKLNSCGKSKI